MAEKQKSAVACMGKDEGWGGAPEPHPAGNCSFVHGSYKDLELCYII